MPNYYPIDFFARLIYFSLRGCDLYHKGQKKRDRVEFLIPNLPNCRGGAPVPAPLLVRLNKP
jgi:hypothetical protein